MRLPTIVDKRPRILEWAALVKHRMVQNQWSITKLAHEVGKSPQFLSQLLNAYTHGRRRPVMPSYELVEALDQKLGLSKERQYQALGLGNPFASDHNNQVSLGPAQGIDEQFQNSMEILHQQYEERSLHNPEARVRALEDRVRALERHLHSLELVESG